MDRKQMLHALEVGKQWNLLVIGGGASGLGAALDASSRGYRTLLLERGDFAQETSSRSTKLIHGGIRYLPQGRISFLRSSLQERAILYQNAPHLVHPQAFILPCQSLWEVALYASGIKLYDFLAGTNRFQASKFLSKSEINTHLPHVNIKNLKGGVCYFDAQFDDARLALNLAQTIDEKGGTALNYFEVVGFLKSKGHLVGVQARDLESQKDYEIQSKIVINATGGCVDFLRKMDDPVAEASLILSQGSHIVLDRSFFPSEDALVIPHGSDGRVLFIIPWNHRILIGTTDILTDGPCLQPIPKEAEIDQLLKLAENYLSKPVTLSDICSSFAGIRALIKPKQAWKGSAQLGRDHAILTSLSQLVSIAGGKWTTYRQMGEDAVDVAAKIAQLPYRPSTTKQLRIHGGVKRPYTSEESILSEWQYYGSDMNLVEGLATDPNQLKKLHPNLPCRMVDVQWAVRHEMARSVQDVLSRRSRCLIIGAKESASIALQVATIMAAELGKEGSWITEQVESYCQLAKQSLSIIK